jgi:hypothetical protein
LYPLVAPARTLACSRIRANFGVVRASSQGVPSYLNFMSTPGHAGFYKMLFCDKGGDVYIEELVHKLVGTGDVVRLSAYHALPMWPLDLAAERFEVQLVRTARSLDATAGRFPKRLPRLIDDEADDGVSVPRSHVVATLEVLFPAHLGATREDKALELRLYFWSSEIMAEVITLKTGEARRVPIAYTAARPERHGGGGGGGSAVAQQPVDPQDWFIQPAPPPRKRGAMPARLPAGYAPQQTQQQQQLAMAALREQQLAMAALREQQLALREQQLALQPAAAARRATGARPQG